jgi:hypothetical protein
MSVAIDVVVKWQVVHVVMCCVYTQAPSTRHVPPFLLSTYKDDPLYERKRFDECGALAAYLEAFWVLTLSCPSVPFCLPCTCLQ